MSNGFALAKGSSRMTVDLAIKLDSVARSLQRHYGTFITTHLLCSIAALEVLKS
jgi:hypothetical protein